MTEVDFREPVSLFDYDQPEIVFAAESSPEATSQPTQLSVTELEETKDPITYGEKKGFWRRQFQPEPTPSQRVFDWGFGVAFPIFCFAADPFVFKGSLGGRAWLGEYMPFAYTLAFVSIVSMIVWLAWGKHFQFANAIFGGLFAVGGLISLLVGLVLLPFSLLGLIVLVGILGLTPLFTSVIYFRNSYRAFLSAEETVPQSLVYHTFFLVGILSFVIPYLINVNMGTWISPLRFIYRAYYGPMF